MIEYKIYELFHAANKKRLHQKEILLRQSQEDTEYLRNIFSVLLPERFSGHAAFHLRYPVSRDSPEPHPPIVLSARRTPESFTPSVDLHRFPMGFHCRYSVVEDSRILSYAPRNVNCPRMAESLKKLRFSKEICAYGRKSDPSFRKDRFSVCS